MEYFKRGKHNSFDAYMAGCSIWFSPRQIILLSDRLSGFVPKEQVDIEAYIDMQSMIDHEAKIKRKKYLED